MSEFGALLQSTAKEGKHDELMRVLTNYLNTLGSDSVISPHRDNGASGQPRRT